MKRHIEIVYDNSSSMQELVGHKKKFKIAQDLFEKEILPTIGLNGDQVFLRLLRKGCQASESYGELLPNQHQLMLDRIKQIDHNQDTPLFYTVYDAVEACKKTKADEHLIFVLTDGDDTCGINIETLIDRDIIEKYVRFYKVLLVQLAVDSPISQNNLSAFTTYLGGQAISLDSVDSLSTMRSKLKHALHVSGFAQNIPLDHCFENLPEANVNWKEIKEMGIDFHQAMVLYNKGMLSWMPGPNVNISSLQLAELKFLHSIVFRSAIPDDIAKSMLSQLKKPYYYSFDCIYWDFSVAQWKYFPKQNKVLQVANEKAFNHDSSLMVNERDFDYKKELYVPNQIYRVVMSHTIEPTFELIPTSDTIGEPKRKAKILKEGDRIIFRW